jgi:hypothetical protein
MPPDEQDERTDEDVEDQEMDAEAAEAEADTKPTERETEDEGDFAVPPPPSGGGRWIWALVFIIILVALVGAAWYRLYHVPQREAEERQKQQEADEHAARQAMVDMRSLLMEVAEVSGEEAMSKLESAARRADEARNLMTEHDQALAQSIGSVRNSIEGVLEQVKEKDAQIRALEKEKKKLLSEEVPKIKEEAAAIYIGGAPAGAATGQAEPAGPSAESTAESP